MSLLSDGEIEAAVKAKQLVIEPFSGASLQPASYDLRVGKFAFSSSGKEKVDISTRGVLVVEAGEFAVIETKEVLGLSPRHAAQIGLRSEYARRGLLMLSGPQADPGFEGLLVVRVVNLSPVNIALPYEAKFLTAQIFELEHDVLTPYRGARQGQTGLLAADIAELSQTEGLTLGEIVKTLGGLASTVASLQTSVARLEGSVNRGGWIVGIALGVIAIIVGVK